MQYIFRAYGDCAAHMVPSSWVRETCKDSGFMPIGSALDVIDQRERS